MSFTTLIFYFFMLTTASSAVAILFSKNVFKAVLFLLTCLLSVAALYVLAFAEFVAVAQILIYAGGLVVVIIFGIMLTSRLSGKPLRADHSHLFSGITSGLALFILLAKLIADSQMPQVMPSTPPNNLHIIGVNLITKFALPFEVTGVLLLIALVGASVLASFTKSNKI